MDLGAWLRGLGLEEYEAAFRQNHAKSIGRETGGSVVWLRGDEQTSIAGAPARTEIGAQI